ncbi:MAG: hypothetical protein GWM98_04755 [Nitrospinaceae bacterium]|nr:hypothetical protein [Deltaproteobacteria bacterium]NIY14230.1 hypothetical protein [Nitrospinaceae bacterium]
MAAGFQWDYSGDPTKSERDEVRFLIGDTCKSDKLVDNREIEYAITKQATLQLAAAMVLRTLAARYTRYVSEKVGDVSTSNVAARANDFVKRAEELDPHGITSGGDLFAMPSFGGLSISEKETLDEDSDAVQPIFRKGQDDIPGGPGDISNTDYDDRLK